MKFASKKAEALAAEAGITLEECEASNGKAVTVADVKTVIVARAEAQIADEATPAAEAAGQASEAALGEMLDAIKLKGEADELRNQAQKVTGKVYARIMLAAHHCGSLGVFNATYAAMQELIVNNVDDIAVLSGCPEAKKTGKDGSKRYRLPSSLKTAAGKCRSAFEHGVPFVVYDKEGNESVRKWADFLEDVNDAIDQATPKTPEQKSKDEIKGKAATTVVAMDKLSPDNLALLELIMQGVKAWTEVHKELAKPATPAQLEAIALAREAFEHMPEAKPSKQEELLVDAAEAEAEAKAA